MRDELVNSILTGDCFDVLADLPAESVHAVVSDPPYGLAFMGRGWDDFEPKEYQEWCEQWATECLRVLKPGGHMLAFSGNRTHHRLFTGVEDAGFEIRDTITWHYGSGFPKASDISKTIDKRADAERESIPNPLADKQTGQYDSDALSGDREPNDTIQPEPATDAAKQWDGFKTGLKPATEFVVMARKPYDGATVDSVLEHGTGALNIEACRISGEVKDFENDSGDSETCYSDGVYGSKQAGTREGRYPSNVVFDEVAAEQLDASNENTDGGRGNTNAGLTGDKYGDQTDSRIETPTYEDHGGPSRYFYTSKATKAERTLDGRIDNAHPTVKPGDLMQWLVKLVTAEGQIVLDPFCGSGTTCRAAKDLGRQFVGIERQERWADVARVRTGLTPDDPSNVRNDADQSGLESYQ